MQTRWMPCSAEGMTLPVCGHNEEIPDLLISGAVIHNLTRRLRDGVGTIRTLAAMPVCNEEAAIAKNLPDAPVHLQLKVEVPKLRIAGQGSLNRFKNPPTDEEFTSISTRALSYQSLAILTFTSEICSIESDMITHFTNLSLKVARILVSVTYGLLYKHGRNPMSYELGALAGTRELSVIAAYFPDTGTDLHAYLNRDRDLHLPGSISEWEAPQRRLHQGVCDADHQALARGVGVDSELVLADNDEIRTIGECAP